MSALALEDRQQPSAAVQLEVSDDDRDAIHILPLSALPLNTKGLNRARLIKNVRLETQINLYRDAAGGSGQIEIDDIPKFFDVDHDQIVLDMRMLSKLSELKSFDPCSLRRGLRQVGIKLESPDVLSLSQSKTDELFPFMSKLTRPLIKYIYGARDLNVQDTNGLMDLIARPDPNIVLPRLRELSRALDTTMADLPMMLEDYGDLCLSLSYYRSSMDTVIPKTRAMLKWFADVTQNSHIGKDPMLKHQFEIVDRLLTRTAKSILRRFNAFDRNIEIDWESVDVSGFQNVRQLIVNHQSSMAEVLCGLLVKVSEWEEKFPDGRASPDSRANFLIVEIRPGIEHMARIEAAAPRF
jgi:hypothetical protein